MTDMKILSVSIAEFGGLRNFRLDLSDGLNIIRGDNESGKSTVLLFVTYALYGLVSKTKDNNDKDKSLSWSNSRAEGALEIESNGKRYKIYRANRGKGSKSEATVTDIDTGEILNINDEPGGYFLGLSRKAFESCVWCGQTRLTSLDGTSISGTLSNLSLSADESVNVENVLDRIRKARKQYKLEKGDGGLIYDTNKKRADARIRERELERISEENIALKAKLLELSAKKERAESRLATAKARCSAASTLKTLRRISELSKLKDIISADKAELDSLVERSGFIGIEPDENDLADLRKLRSTLTEKTAEYLKYASSDKDSALVNEGAAKTAEKIAQRESKEAFLGRIGGRLSAAVKKKTLGIVSALIAVISAALGIILHPAAFVATVIFAALAVTLVSLSVSDTKSISRELEALGTNLKGYENFLEYCFGQLAIYESEKQTRKNNSIAEAAALMNMESAREDIVKKLSEYKAKPTPSAADALDALIGRIGDFLEAKRNLENKIRQNSAIAERDEAELSEYDAEALRLSLPDGINENTVIREDLADEAREAAQKSYDDIREDIARTKAEADANKDCEDRLADVRGEIEKYNERLSEYNQKFEALDRAYSAVSEAYNNMKRNFAPKVRDGAGEYLSAISDGKYSRVMLSDKMEVGVDLFGRSVEARNLSGGTADAVYVSLRLALAKQIFDGATPFFMDESLSQLDDTRASGVLRLIDRFVSEGNQCLLFSCHKRECELCDAMGLTYNKIEL